MDLGEGPGGGGHPLPSFWVKKEGKKASGASKSTPLAQGLGLPLTGKPHWRLSYLLLVFLATDGSEKYHETLKSSNIYLHFWVKREEKTEGKKASGASKSTPPLP